MADSKTHALHTFMAQVTAEMASEYERIHSRAAEDPGTAGDEGEQNWADLLREWLPPNYHIATKGRIVSHSGQMSPQVDVLVLKPFYPKMLREKKVWLAEGVAAAFECKTTLTASHLTESVNRSNIIKGLYTQKNGTPFRELRSSIIYGLLAHSHIWKGLNSRPLLNIERTLSSASNSITHPSRAIDVIGIADLATWTSTYTSCYRVDWVAPEEQSALRAAFGGAWWGPTSAMVCASPVTGGQTQTFKPIAAILSYVTQRLAWADPSLRDLADYYRLAHMWGSASGAMRFWPASIFTDEVRKAIETGRLTNGVIWDEWSIGCL